MLLSRVNIEDKLRRYRNRSAPDILQQVERILEEDHQKDLLIAGKLQNSPSGINKLNFDKLDADRIYHISHIKKICTDYRLRFLDTRYYKGEFPREAVTEIKQLESEHHAELKGFKLVAPAGLFRLKNADDPLLFAPLGNDYFYLIHRWGNDLHPFRKWMMLPFRNLFNLFLLIFVISLAITAMIPLKLFTPHPDASHFWMLFFFVLKSICGITLFYAFALGKNFNGMVWNSKYYN
ncbi:hypothetical protein [Sinomicrobium weinanense]|uniref:Uncharacterized protein n=1 Tax=Sinomicrobium weinanense TaxID=2842200 RepID=A0A926JQW9_9FLAO|nr:hypothetical protein [Sinomicrobium weinanense]MBC9795659.1 hypothetical protein [Sinomicrobium weinanense]MBU3122828.1 hypothetical protein [Sinomicrobium weinanense]